LLRIEEKEIKINNLRLPSAESIEAAATQNSTLSTVESNFHYAVQFSQRGDGEMGFFELRNVLNFSEEWTANED
jgi:hypothetical protein